jgi:integrase
LKGEALDEGQKKGEVLLSSACNRLISVAKKTFLSRSRGAGFPARIVSLSNHTLCTALRQKRVKTNSYADFDGDEEASAVAAPLDLKVPRRPSIGRVIDLNGHVARRRPEVSEFTLWDRELTGFGLRVRPSGHKVWIVKFTHRGRQKKVTLGRVGQMNAVEARAEARRRLAGAATHGLPKRECRGPAAAPTFADYAPEFWRDYARHWKPRTQVTSLAHIERELKPVFGVMSVDRIRRSDVLRWRDTMAGKAATFNRALPVLAVMMKYAEQLAYRPRGSNPCRNTPRYQRPAKERFLSGAEYRRLGRALSEHEADQPDAVAAVRLLMFTGARVSEVLTLRWDDVQSPRLRLPDSKTGPKFVYLNSQAEGVLSELRARRAGELVFPGRSGDTPRLTIWGPWSAIRRAAALPDVRLHDLRHSFASVAVNNGVPLVMIGRLLGHALAETTAGYAHLEDRSLADAAVRVSGSLASAMGIGQ